MSTTDIAIIICETILAIAIGIILWKIGIQVRKYFMVNKTLKNISDEQIQKIKEYILPYITKKNLDSYMRTDYVLYMYECNNYIHNMIVHDDDLKRIILDTEKKYDVLNNIESLDEIADHVVEILMQSEEELLKKLYYDNLYQNIQDSNKDAEEYEAFLQSFPDTDDDVELHPAEYENTPSNEREYYPSITEIYNTDTIEDIEDDK